jgi:uncharacterized cupredoxin-like copper-binding protein
VGSFSSTAGIAVDVTATEYAFTLSRKDFTPGTYTFQMDNAGSAPHAMTIKGPGVESASSETVQGGAQAHVTVTLQPGRYQMWCPVGNHRQLGMQLTFDVK